MEQRKTQPTVWSQGPPPQNPAWAAQPVHRPMNKKSQCPLRRCFRGRFTQHYNGNGCVILRFMRNSYLIFVPILGTGLLIPLEFHK